MSLGVLAAPADIITSRLALIDVTLPFRFLIKFTPLAVLPSNRTLLLLHLKSI